MKALKALRNESGAMLVLIALLLVAFLATFALAVDVGVWLNARAEAQRAADAAALAGAGVFLYAPGDPERPINMVDGADAEAREFAARNYIGRTGLNAAVLASVPDPPTYCTEGTDVDVCVEPDKQLVRVAVRGETPALFARFLGLFDLGVSARAAARVFEAGTASCVKPFAIPDMWNEATEDTDGNDVWDFDIDAGCKGNNCDEPEVWSFDPSSGDVYDRDMYGYGTGYRDGNQNWRNQSHTGDYGRRLPIKIQSAQDVNVASYWYPWVIPGSNPGLQGVIDNIRSCVDEASIGQDVDFDVETKNGNSPNPIYDAMKELVDLDPDAEWDDATNTVVYPDGSDSPYQGSWKSSPRVMTVAVFNPEDMQSGKNYMRFVDFMEVFLEDPDEVYPGVNPSHHAPITARMIGYVQGQRGPQTGVTTRVLQLVQ